MKTAIFFLILIFFSDLFLGLGLKFYRLFYFDMILHFGGGFFVAMFFASFLFKNSSKSADKPIIKAKFLILALIILGATTFVGVFWELLEYLSTIYFREYIIQRYKIICCIGNLDDTIGDLTMDIIGGVIFISIYLKSLIKSSKD